MQEFNHLIVESALALVFANVLIEQIGMPVPAAPTLVLAGALAAEGSLSAPAAVWVTLAACTIGDLPWYIAGRIYGNRTFKVLCRLSLYPDSCVQQAESLFKRWGGLMLISSKFLPGLATVAPPLAGAIRLGWPTFLLLNSIGAVIWAAAAIGTGMVFHEQINELVERLGDLGALAGVLVTTLVAAYIGLKWWGRQRVSRV